MYKTLASSFPRRRWRKCTVIVSTELPRPLRHNHDGWCRWCGRRGLENGTILHWYVSTFGFFLEGQIQSADYIRMCPRWMRHANGKQRVEEVPPISLPPFGRHLFHHQLACQRPAFYHFTPFHSIDGKQGLKLAPKGVRNYTNRKRSIIPLRGLEVQDLVLPESFLSKLRQGAQG